MDKQKQINKEPFIHLSRRSNDKISSTIIAKTIAIILALIMCGVVSNIIAPNSFGIFFKSVFFDNFVSVRRGVTTFSISKLINVIWPTAILFIIALSATPAFKMKFWNIGAEGQVLMGAFFSLIVMKWMAPSINNNFLVLVLMLLFAIIGSVIWAIIPALLKAFLNTNETLLTLMLNYIATAIVSYFSYAWRAEGKTAIGVVNESNKLGWIPQVTLWDGNSYDYVIGIFIVILIGIAMWAYFKYSKHGYEIAVVGGSVNTARYIGINIKKVILRTLVLCGAISGVAGWLLVAGGAHSVTENLVNGRGFTGVLVSWLGFFQPGQMGIYAFLVSFITKGSEKAASVIGYSAFVSDILVGLFFFFVIAADFFLRFNVNFSKSFKDNLSNFKNKIFRKKVAEGGNEDGQ